MNGTEIERKFLVDTTTCAYKESAHRAYRICQGYICKASGKTVRVRIRDNEGFLTIKGPSADGIGRYEFETKISLDDAMSLMKLCDGGTIDKTRYLVTSPDGRHTWEIDEFYGDNEGLVMAEIELAAADEPYTKPDFITTEVTGDKRYYNSHLLSNPYKNWK
ncbi:MAG: CYTH domain-containing protein [Bacteroidaceae bacterium]|nr:CYTH domain-containing protein [Bacteroidaceae bacterium]